MLGFDVKVGFGQQESAGASISYGVTADVFSVYSSVFKFGYNVATLQNTSLLSDIYNSYSYSIFSGVAPPTGMPSPVAAFAGVDLRTGNALGSTGVPVLGGIVDLAEAGIYGVISPATGLEKTPQTQPKPGSAAGMSFNSAPAATAHPVGKGSANSIGPGAYSNPATMNVNGKGSANSIGPSSYGGGSTAPKPGSAAGMSFNGGSSGGGSSAASTSKGSPASYGGKSGGNDYGSGSSGNYGSYSGPPSGGGNGGSTASKPSGSSGMSYNGGGGSTSNNGGGSSNKGGSTSNGGTTGKGGGNNSNSSKFGGARPIGIDLDGGGVALVALGASTASFDFNKDGAREKSAWIGKGDGFLAIDLERASWMRSKPQGCRSRRTKAYLTCFLRLSLAH
jgi:hypothetical protein